jgi:hypothetical protein
MEDDLDLGWLDDLLADTGDISGANTSELDSLLDWAVKSGDTSFLAGLGNFLKSDSGKKTLAGIAGGALPFIMGDSGSGNRPTGYQGGIPSYTMQRSLREGVFDPSERRPGSMGRSYFTDYTFVPKASNTGIANAGTTNTGTTNTGTTNTGTTEADRDPNDEGMARGGIAMLKEGSYLRGPTDGMEDKLRTSIEGKQPAALSHGEFVVPADVVSHLGNGNSEAGAKQLYEMMDRIRKARTGTTEQGRQVNPDKYLPR